MKAQSAHFHFMVLYSTAYDWLGLGSCYRLTLFISLPDQSTWQTLTRCANAMSSHNCASGLLQIIGQICAFNSGYLYLTQSFGVNP